MLLTRQPPFIPCVQASYLLVRKMATRWEQAAQEHEDIESASCGPHPRACIKQDAPIRKFVEIRT